MTDLRYGPVEQVLEQLMGAEISECRASEVDGLHISFRDGRTLVVVCTGYMGIHIYAEDDRVLN